MKAHKYILITRPEEEAKVFARKLKHEGFNPKIEPMLEIEYLNFEVPHMEDYQALIFTSVNAVRGLAAKMKKRLGDVDRPSYCIGDRTAREAREHGLTQVSSAKGTTKELIELVHNKVPDESMPLLYVRGEHTAQPVDKMLKELGYKVHTVTVYVARPVKNLSLECITAIKSKQIDAITFFSKRTVETFLREVKKHGLLKEFFGIKLLSLSDSMLECVRSYRQAKTYTAMTPDAPGMLRLLKRLYKKELGL